MNRTKTTSLVAVAILAGTACSGRDLYENDFAARSSFRAMPGSQWYSSAYSTALPAPLAYRFTQTTTNMTPLSAYGDLSKMQDGWIMAVGPDKRRYVDFWVRTLEGSDNPCACASNMKAYYNQYGSGMILQPLYNSFTNGYLRVSADFKAPAKLGTASDENMRVSLLRESANPPRTYSLGPSATTFGIMEGCTTLRATGASGWGYSARIPDSGNVDKTHWFRLVLDADLGNRTYVLAAYDMGTQQPTLETATPNTPYGVADNGHLAASSDNPISAIAFYTVSATYKSTASDGTVTATNCPAVDNLRVWWRADAGSFDESSLCYENDFLTRRVRTLAPGTITAGYASSLVETNAETYVFAEGYATSVQNDTSNLAPYTSAKTTGRDDWLQVQYGRHLGKVYATGRAGGNVLALILSPGYDNYYARINHPIGTAIDTQYVKVECDVRTQSDWANYGNSSWVAFLGLYGDNAFSSYAARFGFTTDAWANRGKFFPYYRTANGTVKDTSTELKPSTWYRLKVVCNRTTGKLSYEIYELGSDSGTFDRAVPATSVYSIDNVDFDGTKVLTHYAFEAYDIGNTFATAPLLDNVRIWKGTDGTNWNLVYQNDFNRRVRYGLHTVQEAKLLPDDINRVGLDGWIRRGAGAGDMYVRNASNPYATIESEGGFAHAVQTFSRPEKSGKIVVRADIRPPSRMTDKADYPGCVYVGGDTYAQGEIGTQTGLQAFTDAAFGCFGFARSGAIQKMDFYNHATLFAKDGNGEHLDAVDVDLTAWYRFVAKLDLDAKTWCLDVYRQGTSQPTADSADGTLVKSFENLVFAYDDPSGFSALGIAGGGTTGDKPLEADKGSVLFDNLKVTGSEAAFFMFVR